jgi:hypothetical protein
VLVTCYYLPESNENMHACMRRFQYESIYRDFWRNSKSFSFLFLHYPPLYHSLFWSSSYISSYTTKLLCMTTVWISITCPEGSSLGRFEDKLSLFTRGTRTHFHTDHLLIEFILFDRFYPLYCWIIRGSEEWSKSSHSRNDCPTFRTRKSLIFTTDISEFSCNSVGFAHVVTFWIIFTS